MSSLKEELNYSPPGTPGSPRSPVDRNKETVSGEKSSLFVTLANSHPPRKKFMFLECLQVLVSPAISSLVFMQIIESLQHAKPSGH